MDIYSTCGFEIETKIDFSLNDRISFLSAYETVASAHAQPMNIEACAQIGHDKSSDIKARNYDDINTVKSSSHSSKHHQHSQIQHQLKKKPKCADQKSKILSTSICQ